jgi:NhaP-type Na+/H+ or K+/H+ antiporter
VFAVILFTLVVQGLSLPAVIRRLGVTPDDDADAEAEARRHAAAVALERLDELSQEDWTHDDSVERLRGLYHYRQARFASRLRADDDGRYEDMTDAWTRMQCSLISAQRDAIEALRREGSVSDEVARRVTYELDLEETRIRT